MRLLILALLEGILLQDVTSQPTRFIQSCPASREKLPDVKPPDDPPLVNLSGICKDKVDVVFLMDASGSVSKAAFTVTQGALANLVKSLHIDIASGFAVGVIRFGNLADTVVSLSPFHTKDEIALAITNTAYLGGTKTMTHEGIEAATMMLTQGRKSAAMMMFIISDFRSSHPSLTFKAALVARRKMIHIVAVGITSQVRTSEMRSVAGRSLSFTTDNFLEFEKKLLSFFATSCVRLDACWDCKVVSGAGYNPEYGDCNAYRVCTGPGYGHGIRQYCSLGLFWNQNILTCDYPGNVNCRNDPCKLMASSSGSVPYNNNCRAYWTCKNKKTSGYGCCAAGFYYNSGNSNCEPDSDKKCEDTCPCKKVDLVDNNACKDFASSSGSLPYAGNCRGYWTCTTGRTLGYGCCVSGFYFNSRNSVCEPDSGSTCSDSCPCEEEKVVNWNCTLSAVPGDPKSFYQTYENGIKRKFPCPFGLLFSQDHCLCAIRVQSDGCLPELYIDFEGRRIIDKSRNNYRLGFKPRGSITKMASPNATDGWAGTFLGKGHIFVTGFSNSGFRLPLYIYIRFKNKPRTLTEPKEEILVNNIDCNGDSSLRITLDREAGMITGLIKTVRGFNPEVSVAQEATDWVEVWLVYNGNTLVIQSKSSSGLVKTKTNYGQGVILNRGPLRIGGACLGLSTDSLLDYKGCIDLFAVYYCDPR